MSTKAKPTNVAVHVTGEDELREAEAQRRAVSNDDEEGETLNEALSIFARELKEELLKATEIEEDEQQEQQQQQRQAQFSIVWELLYYHPKVYVKGAVVLLFVTVLTLLLTLKAHLMLTATWSLLGGLVVVSIFSTEVAWRVRERRESGQHPDNHFVREWRCASFDVVKSCTKEDDAGKCHGAGSYVILALFGAFGACSVFILEDEATSFAFLLLFGVFGIVVVLLIGFHAWSKTLGVESYIVVEALFDILLASQLSATNAVEIAYNAATIALGSIATVCAFVRLTMRLNDNERKSERILLAAFLTTDAADVVLLASQLFLNASCDLDPKIVVIAGLLALNPCVTELSAAFKSDEEKTISQNIQRMLQDSERDEDKLQALQEKLFDEQVKRRRMENKSIVQTIVVGLGVFPVVYALSLVERQTNWYLVFIPIIVLIVYAVDAQYFHYAYSRAVLNKYFYAAAFRLCSALWALLLVLTPVYADAINCNESTAFIIWALYSVVALLVVTVIKSVQREELLIPLGQEKYEDLVPKILRPARADLASYYVDKLNGSRGNTKGRNKPARKIVYLLASELKSGRDKPLVISSLLDAMAYILESESDGDVRISDVVPKEMAADFARLFWQFYSRFEDDEPYVSFRGSLERAVTTLALLRDVKVLREVVDAVQAAVESTCEDEDTLNLRLRSFSAVLDARETVLAEILGRYGHAEVLARLALKIARGTSEGETEDTTVANYLNNIAELLRAQGKFDEAKPLYEEALDIKRTVYGNEHPSVATSLNNIAGLLSAQGKFDEAKPLYEEALEIKRNVYGNEHPRVARGLNNLAWLYRVLGDYAKALELCTQALTIVESVYGKEHPDYARQLNSVALLLSDQGQLDKAKQLYNESLAIRRNVLRSEHPDVAQSLNNLADLLKAQGKYDKAKPMHKESLRMRRRVFGNEHPDVATSLNSLAGLLRAQGKYDEAKPMYDESLRIRRKALGNEHPDVAQSLNNIAELLRAQGNLDEAKPMLEEALTIRRKKLGNEHPDVAQSLNNLALLLKNQDKNSKEADRLGKEALRIAEKRLGNDHPTTEQYRRDWG